ncbi:MAG: methylated-DNA--[Oscillospiraceae bacterium]|nr:methylated-DNA--[protein]-cysteine S-methyltransferase [Oscillospiraceae bacterium]
MTEFYVKQTLFGAFKLGVEGNSVVYLKLTDEKQSSSFSTLAEQVFAQLDEYFKGERTAFDFPFKLAGTPFQLKVRNTLLNIPYGETRSYKEIACAAGNPKAVRAVGSACKNNPVWIAVPCHRVISSDGSLSGYAGGAEMKRQLLELEKGNSL